MIFGEMPEAIVTPLRARHNARQPWCASGARHNARQPWGTGSSLIRTDTGTDGYISYPGLSQDLLPHESREALLTEKAVNVYGCCNSWLKPLGRLVTLEPTQVRCVTGNQGLPTT